MEEIHVKRAQRGDKESFAAIIMPLRTEAYRIALCFLHNENDSMEAVCSAVEKAFKSIRQLKKASKFKSWFIQIVVNECRLQIRDRNRQQSLTNRLAVELPDSRDIAADKMDLEKLLMSLEPMDRLVIHLKYYSDYTLREIAELLQLSEGTVKTRLYSRLKWMKLQLDVREE